MVLTSSVAVFMLLTSKLICCSAIILGGRILLYLHTFLVIPPLPPPPLKPHCTGLEMKFKLRRLSRWLLPRWKFSITVWFSHRVELETELSREVEGWASGASRWVQNTRASPCVLVAVLIAHRWFGCCGWGEVLTVGHESAGSCIVSWTLVSRWQWIVL